MKRNLESAQVGVCHEKDEYASFYRCTHLGFKHLADREERENIEKKRVIMRKDKKNEGKEKYRERDKNRGVCTLQGGRSGQCSIVKVEENQRK